MRNSKKMKIVIDFFGKEYSEDISTHPNNLDSDPFRVLISTILSQRTREENTWEATDDLFSVIGSPKELLTLSDEKIQSLIRKSGFYRQKSRTIKKVASILVKNFNGIVPKERKLLISLPGVGPKTADVVLSHSFGKPNIAIDVHVDVISKRLGIADEGMGYEETRKILEELTPENERNLVNLGFVFFGRRICLTAHPKCRICPLKPICRHYENASKT